MNKNKNKSMAHGAAVRGATLKPYLMLIAASALIAAPVVTQARIAVDKPLAIATDSDSGKNNAGAKLDNKPDNKQQADKKTPAAHRIAPAPQCVGELPATVNVNLPEGKSGVLDLPKLQLPAPAWLRTLADPDVVQVEPVTSATARNMFFLFGKKIGSTNLMFQNKDGRCAMIEVSVGVDTAAVQAKLVQLMPNEKDIRISAAADSLVLSGTVADSLAVDKIMSIANAFVRKGGGLPGAGGERVVNMLSIGAPQQVMLEVKVAEISKTVLDQLGSNFSATLNRGNWAAGVVSNFFGNGAGSAGLGKTNGTDFLQIDAQKKDGVVKILAEPTIMAISGQEGSFLAGGKIFIPVAQDISGRITLEEKEFGVGLRFTPTVLDGGRINLKVAPEVSELSREGIGLSSSATGGRAILPLITTRRAATTVQLFDGQSFAIGGLIKNNVTQNVRAMPLLGEVPVLGALFRSSDFQTDRTELVFIVTPRLAKPLPASYPLPTDRFVEPTRAEFFMGGKMEGTPPVTAPAASPTTAPATAPANAAAAATAQPARPVAALKAITPTGFDIK